MEYRIEASVVLEPAYVARLIMAWYREPAARPVSTATAFRPHTGQLSGTSTSQRFGAFTSGTNVRPSAMTGATAAERASDSFAKRHTSQEKVNTFPIATQPAVIRSETNFAIAPGMRLQKVSGLGDFKLDYFFWQTNQVLILERLSGRHYWIQLKEGWDNPQVANPKPVSLGRFNPDVPMKIPVNQMTDTEKLAEVTRRAIPLIKKSGVDALEDQIESLTDPETIAIMLAIIGVSTLFPVVGIGFAILGAFYLGEDAVKVLDDLINFVKNTLRAETEANLDEAAINLTGVVVGGGVIIWELLSKKRSKSRKLVKKQPNADAKATPVYKEPNVEPVQAKPSTSKNQHTPPDEPSVTVRDKNGRLRDRKTGEFVKDPNKKPGVSKKKDVYSRNMSERRKALLRDANDPNSDLSFEARAHIRKTNGNSVPPGYEVSHEIPLYTRTTNNGKASIDKARNMKTQPRTIHRDRHKICGDQYHRFGAANKPKKTRP